MIIHLIIRIMESEMAVIDLSVHTPQSSSIYILPADTIFTVSH